MNLKDLEREAYNTQNKLALEILARVEAEYEQMEFAEYVKPRYVGEAQCK
jgi:hypothetical protein